jgi:hypothetical protein
MLNEASRIQARPEWADLLKTHGDVYGRRAARAGVIKFISSIFGSRANEKVRDRRAANTMWRMLEGPLICMALKMTIGPTPVSCHDGADDDYWSDTGLLS